MVCHCHHDPAPASGTLTTLEDASSLAAVAAPVAQITSVTTGHALAAGDSTPTWTAPAAQSCTPRAPPSR